MAAIIKSTYSVVQRFNELGDPRVENLFLMSSPWPILAITASYLYFVLVCGPKWMEKRKPFNIDRIIQVYNVLQIIVCAYLFYMGYTKAWGWGAPMQWLCEPIDYSNSAYAQEIVFCVWLYFIVKLVDLLDTVFFVLRKKNSQITFLHVYHHIAMLLGCWFATKYFPGGQSTFLGTINCFVHMVMYGYYFVTSAWPEYRKNLWWKKYITQLQMVQFLAFVVQNGACWLKSDCDYPRGLCMFIFIQNVIMLFMFSDFYVKAYFKKKSS